MLKCPRCRSTNITFAPVPGRTKGYGLLHRLGRGTLMAGTFGLWALFGARQSNIKTKTMATCQNCGKGWKAK